MSDVFSPAWNLVKRDMGPRGYEQMMDPLGSYIDPDEGIYLPDSGFRMPTRPPMQISDMDINSMLMRNRDRGYGPHQMQMDLPAIGELMAQNKKLVSDAVMMRAEIQQLRQILDGLMAGGGVRGMGGSYMTPGALEDEGGRMDFMEGEGIYDMLREMYNMPDEIQDQEYRQMLGL
tara:strand:+ start:52 stop:576 length:525 start_codon:yes stop_codon:yes gene_type:complete